MTDHAFCLLNNTIRMVMVWLIFAIGVNLKWWTGDWWLIPLVVMFYVMNECEEKEGG